MWFKTSFAHLSWLPSQVILEKTGFEKSFSMYNDAAEVQRSCWQN